MLTSKVYDPRFGGPYTLNLFLEVWLKRPQKMELSWGKHLMQQSGATCWLLGGSGLL